MCQTFLQVCLEVVTETWNNGRIGRKVRSEEFDSLVVEATYSSRLASFIGTVASLGGGRLQGYVPFRCRYTFHRELQRVHGESEISVSLGFIQGVPGNTDQRITHLYRRGMVL